MVEVLIWGVGQSGNLVESILDKSKVKIIGYVDNNKEKWGRIKNDVLIYNPLEINEITYDSLIIASQFYDQIITQIQSIGIKNRSIINAQKMIENSLEKQFKEASYSFYFNKLSRDLTTAIKATDISTLITGLSYAECGVITHKKANKAMNFANAGQDIFYDYIIIKKILEKSKSQIKNVVIGLSYYSFEYDLSLSKVHGLRCKYIYEPILGESHHLYNAFSNEMLRVSMVKRDYFEEFESDLFISKENLSEIIKYHGANFEVPKLESFERWSLPDKKYNGQLLAELDSKKNYPLTVEENKEILSSLLELLIQKNINVSIIVFPVTKYYRKFFNSRLKDQFYLIINKLLDEYRFTLVDLFSSNLFEESDFSNSSHLNYNGAVKTTNIIESLLK